MVAKVSLSPTYPVLRQSTTSLHQHTHPHLRHPLLIFPSSQFNLHLPHQGHSPRHTHLIRLFALHILVLRHRRTDGLYHSSRSISMPLQVWTRVRMALNVYPIAPRTLRRVLQVRVRYPPRTLPLQVPTVHPYLLVHLHPTAPTTTYLLFDITLDMARLSFLLSSSIR